MGRHAPCRGAVPRPGRAAGAGHPPGGGAERFNRAAAALRRRPWGIRRESGADPDTLRPPPHAQFAGWRYGGYYHRWAVPSVYQICRCGAGPGGQFSRVRLCGPPIGRGGRAAAQLPHPGQKRRDRPDGGLSRRRRRPGPAGRDRGLSRPGEAGAAGAPRLQPPHLQHHGPVGADKGPPGGGYRLHRDRSAQRHLVRLLRLPLYHVPALWRAGGLLLWRRDAGGGLSRHAPVRRGDDALPQL